MDKLKQEEKIDAAAYDAQLSNKYNAATIIYNKDKKIFDGDRARIIRDAEQQQEKFSISMDSSVNHLSQQFPGFDQNALSEVKKVLASGDITSLFVNQDGTYNEKAALSIARVLYGDQIQKDQVHQAAVDGNNKAIEETVFLADKQPKVSKSHVDAKVEKEKEGVKHLSNLKKAYSSSPYRNRMANQG